MLSFGYMPDTHGGPYQQPEPTPERSADFAEQLLLEAEQAERHGFDGVFIPERHARTECMFPSPLPLLAAIAARTKRVRIGTDILMPPLYNPVELAQSVGADRLALARPPDARRRCRIPSGLLRAPGRSAQAARRSI